LEPAIKQANSLAASIIPATSRCWCLANLTLSQPERRFPFRRKSRRLLRWSA